MACRPTVGTHPDQRLAPTTVDPRHAWMGRTKVRPHQQGQAGTPATFANALRNAAISSSVPTVTRTRCGQIGQLRPITTPLSAIALANALGGIAQHLIAGEAGIAATIPGCEWDIDVKGLRRFTKARLLGEARAQQLCEMRLQWLQGGLGRL